MAAMQRAGVLKQAADPKGMQAGDLAARASPADARVLVDARARG
jgi:hypothetical protein